MEMLASEILLYDAMQVPDLLQTASYARAVAESDPEVTEPGILDRLTQVSITCWQGIMSQCGTAVTAVIGEAALWQQVGSVDVMHDQMRWLAEVSGTCPWVTLQILPFESGIHPNCTGHMSILRLAEAPSLGVVHLRGLDGGVCRVDQAAILGHIRAFTHLQLSALPPDRSAQLLHDMATPSQVTERFRVAQDER